MATPVGPSDGGDHRIADLVALAAMCCQTPVAFFVAADAVRAPAVVVHGSGPDDLSDQLPVCRQAIRELRLVVADDPFAEARLATDRLKVLGRRARFQAAMPVLAADGSALGALCIADGESRTLRVDQLEALERAARQIAAALEIGGRMAELVVREVPLRQRAVQQAAAADLGQRALRGLDVHTLMQEAAELVADKLGLDFCQLWELLPDGKTFILRAGVGWPVTDIGSLTIPVDPRSQPGFNLLNGGSVFIDDVSLETRFAPPAFVAKQGAISGFSVSIPGPVHPYGVIGGHVLRHQTFTDDDASFQQSVANVVGAAIERRRAEEEVRHQATHDALTGLANRALLLDNLGAALKGSDGRRTAVLFLDLDRFKLINDSLGHDVGDELLISVAARLRGVVRPGDTLARFGGDEFVVLLDHVAGVRAARAVAKRVATALEEPVLAGGDEHVVTASVGVAVAARRHTQPETLLREADAAMYRAKRRARGSVELFDDSMLAAATSELRIERALRTALGREDFEVFYQPLVSLEEGKIVGLEALLRWVDPDLGPVSPSEFIPIAEDSGLIVGIGEWVLREACRQMSAWTRGASASFIPVSVNVSARQLKERDFPSVVASALEQSGLDPGQLSLEITETVLVEGVETPIETLAALKELGVRLVLDDFGTGYSSLSYLKRFPLDVIKIDRSFVTGLGSPGHDSAIVDAVLAMSRALGLTVVAEGIEDDRQLVHLRERGAEIGQGYLFAPPMAAEAVWPLLVAGTIA